MNYEAEFHEANARRELFGKDPLPFEKSTSWFLDEVSLRKMILGIQRETRNYTAEQMAGQCATVSMRLAPLISAILGAKTIFTLGYFSVGETKLFYFDENTLRQWAHEGPPQFPLVEVHAWLTLPSFEIIDSTIASSLGVAQNFKEALGRAITLHYSKLTGGMEYHPVILGEDMLPVFGLQQLLLYEE
jgi:hypothetical protein